MNKQIMIIVVVIIVVVGAIVISKANADAKAKQAKLDLFKTAIELKKQREGQKTKFKDVLGGIEGVGSAIASIMGGPAGAKGAEGASSFLDGIFGSKA